MKIAVDVDEVLFDLSTPLCRFHNETYGTNLTIEDYVDYDLSKVWGCSDEEVISRWFRFYGSDYFKKVRPIKDSIRTINKLFLQHDLVILTSRPGMVHEETISLVESFFPRTFGEYIFSNDSYLISGNFSKAKFCLDKGVSLLIDDNLENVLGCVESGVKAILFDLDGKYPYNKSKNGLPKGAYRCLSWKETFEKIKLIS